MVGAFWVLPGPRVIGETVGLSHAERVGESYNGPSGHEPLWPTLPKPASFLGCGYSTVPRGRVLYRGDESRFVIFAAPEIVRDVAARKAVEAFYGLSGSEHRWETDFHYTTEPDLIDESDNVDDT
jgi:hypothetical protein